MAGQDVYENEMQEDSNPTWMRTLSSDGSGRRTKASIFEKSGSRYTLKGFRIPEINTKAVKIASFNKFNGFLNSSVMVCADTFGLSFYGIIGIETVGERIIPFAQLNVHKTNGASRILFVDNGLFLDMYITGSYSSEYSTSMSSVFSMSEYVSFDGIGKTVSIASLIVKTSLTIGSDT